MTTLISRSVVQKVLSIEKAEGAGATVRRSIGTNSLPDLSPFLLLDHLNIAPGAGFPDHPHRGQSTVTFMLEGSFQHEDSEGHRGIIGPGDLQWMIAGRGIIHAEMPVHGPGVPNPTGLQLWVDLPKEHKMVKPSYQELKAEEIPSVFPDGPDGPTEIKLISGKSYGVESPVRPLGGCWYMHIKLKKKGAAIFQDLPEGWNSFLYTLKGSVLVNPSSGAKAHGAYHTLVLSTKQGEDGVALEAAEDNTEFVLISGEPLKQQVVKYGPFVLSSQEELEQAIVDYQTGRNGFEKARTWKSKIGNAKA